MRSLGNKALSNELVTGKHKRHESIYKQKRFGSINLPGGAPRGKALQGRNTQILLVQSEKPVHLASH